VLCRSRVASCECRRYAAATLHPHWCADIARLSATVDASAQLPQMWRWAASNAANRRDALAVVLKLLNLLGRLPVLEILLPLPGAHKYTPTAVSDADEKALKLLENIDGTLELGESPLDPVADIAIRKVTSITWCRRRTIQVGRIAAPVPAEWLLPVHARRWSPERSPVAPCRY
jgi:hypothetical protein